MLETAAGSEGWAGEGLCSAWQGTTHQCFATGLLVSGACRPQVIIAGPGWPLTRLSVRAAIARSPTGSRPRAQTCSISW